MLREFRRWLIQKKIDAFEEVKNKRNLR
jgi:hypothetical protein